VRVKIKINNKIMSDREPNIDQKIKRKVRVSKVRKAKVKPK